jgi:hypothetical protein
VLTRGTLLVINLIPRRRGALSRGLPCLAPKRWCNSRVHGASASATCSASPKHREGGKQVKSVNQRNSLPVNFVTLGTISFQYQDLEQTSIIVCPDCGSPELERQGKVNRRITRTLSHTKCSKAQDLSNVKSPDCLGLSLCMRPSQGLLVKRPRARGGHSCRWCSRPSVMVCRTCSRHLQ